MRYKLLAGSAGVVWYEVLVTAFIFEHVVPVTSLLGYQTKQKVAARSGERNENVFFINTCILPSVRANVRHAWPYHMKYV